MAYRNFEDIVNVGEFTERIILLQDQIKKHGGTLPPAEAKSKK